MKKIGMTFIGCLVMAGSLFSCGSTPQQDEPVRWSERMAQSEMTRFPEPWMIEKATKPRWGYTHGLVVKSILETWKQTGNQAYFDYAKIYADSLINEDGKIRMNYLSFNIDNINPGKALFDLYEQTNDPRYKVAMDTLVKQMSEQPRTSEGSFWHKKVYGNQMWLDGIFMASPYLAQYGQEFNDTTLFDEVVKQVTLMAKYSYDSKTGLYFHGWDESKKQVWANKETGCSPNIWSRSIGWYAAAIVDVLDYLPQNTQGRDEILAIVDTLAKNIVKYQDADTGVWWQVTDQGNREGNYLESSASALIIYFLSKAINEGYIDKDDYITATTKGFNGLVKEFIKPEPNGTFTLVNCCAVAGLGGKGNRDGSFAYYISEPIIENDPKSVGSFILAALEYEKLTDQDY